MTATPPPSAWDHFVYSQQPSFDETATRAAFVGAVPLMTVVIYCYDPRAAAIPAELTKLWPDEIYPRDLIRDEYGHKVGSTATIFPIVVAGGSSHRRLALHHDRPPPLWTAECRHRSSHELRDKQLHTAGAVVRLPR